MMSIQARGKDHRGDSWSGVKERADVTEEDGVNRVRWRQKSKNIEGFNVQVQITLQYKQQQQKEKNIIDAADVGIWCYI